MEEEKEEREEEVISGKQGWEEDGAQQSWQHFLKGAGKDLAHDLGRTLGRENTQSPHAPGNNYLLKIKRWESHALKKLIWYGLGQNLPRVQ